MFAIPYEYYEKYGIRRYGMHGTSHRYVAGEMINLLGGKAEGTKIVTCHIGNGSSISAVKDGKVMDVSSLYYLTSFTNAIKADTAEEALQVLQEFFGK